MVVTRVIVFSRVMVVSRVIVLAQEVLKSEEVQKNSSFFQKCFGRKISFQKIKCLKDMKDEARSRGQGGP